MAPGDPEAVEEEHRQRSDRPALRLPRETMEPLARVLRGKLEQTVQEARNVAEEGADAVLKHLGVGLPQSPAYLSDKEKDLSASLSAHAQVLGDTYSDAARGQVLPRLREEVAYEHWHCMLFARFLAEN